MATPAGRASLGTDGVLYTDRRDFYPDAMDVATDYASQAPFLSMLMARGPKKVNDPDYKLFEYYERFLNQRLQVNAGAGASWGTDGSPGDTLSVAVDNPNNLNVNSSLVGLIFKAFDSTYLSDPGGATYKGHALCTGIDPSTTTLTLKSLGSQSDADHAASALADDDVLVVVGAAYGEGAEAPEPDYDDLQTVFNSVEDFRTAVEITSTLRATALRGERDELARLRRVRFKEHKQRIDYALWFGIRVGGIGAGNDTEFLSHIHDAQGRKVRTTMGLITALERYGDSTTTSATQNVFSVNEATFTYEDWIDVTEKLFQYAPDDDAMVAFAGPKFISYLTKLALSENNGWTIEMSDPRANRIGFNFRELLTPHGLLRLVPEYGWRGTPYEGALAVIDENSVDLRHHEEANAFYTNIKTDNNPRIIKDEYYSNLGLGIRQIKKSALIKLA